MKKRVNKDIIVFGIVFTLMIVGVLGVVFLSESNVEAATSVSCSLMSKASCSGTGKTVIIGLSDLTNGGHASKNNADDYANVLCCSGGTAITGTCPATQRIVRLSSANNAHVANASSTQYTTDVCYNGVSNCVTSTATSVSGKTKLLTISSAENAHVAGTTNGYNLGVWCTMGGGTTQTPCTDYQTRDTCWSNATQNCTWAPVNETVRVQNPTTGLYNAGCCEGRDEEIFNTVTGTCGGTTDEMCFDPWDLTQTPGSMVKNSTNTNPSELIWNQYCEQAAASWGYWTDVGKF